MPRIARKQVAAGKGQRPCTQFFELWAYGYYPIPAGSNQLHEAGINKSSRCLKPVIIRRMPGARSYAAKLVLVLLIAYGVVSSQAAWLTPEHSHRGEPEHCCGICHAGHL